MINNFSEEIRNIVITEGLKNKRINEISLAKKLGISRTSIREILKHLEEEGLIVRIRGVGIKLKVASFKEVLEAYDIRILLEGLAVRYLVENLNEEILKKIRKAIRDFRLAKKERNGKKILMAELRFHNLIINNCGSRRLAQIVSNLNLITHSFRIFNRIHNIFIYDREVKYPHEKILEALELRDAEKAERLIQLHIEEGKNTIMKFLLGPSVGNITIKRIIKNIPLLYKNEGKGG
ncbi:MAG: GntR family transcriptional regulator [Candidatus Omnitrophica bacterium]|nr:GntR family transcriptional regulator [Candidatus Omnitrophota bacterium]